ncbi:Na+/H+ antiporter subunit E [Teichococcus oryzae]|uniref:Na+/H+ antiporter subunit E n=1 Tax=Teichococcus oryzae TaxID=1608942 RepID=A0A5B2TE35_9PROT|nr:Na+/H+ antiporter subunit E [Pseudoroseomonas oryzae]KAA2212128.1 Na+/H+ antiporter subunit E [Pseudoroseomonas oryzae]
MSRILPHPVVSAALFIMWLLMNQTVSPGPALVGAVLALLGGWALALLRPGRPRLGPARAVLRLTGVVLVDIARSNLAVARVILSRQKSHYSSFVHVQLRLRNPQALAILACILTAAPGTAWIEFDPEEGWLLLHVLDLPDQDSWAHIIQNRYEKPLMEIFP